MPRQTPDTGSTAMTIVVIGSGTRRATANLVARLAELAVNDELLVVFGSDDRPHQPTANALAVGLRDRLPRYDIVTLYVAPTARAIMRNAALVDEFMEVGSLPIVVTPSGVVDDVATGFSSYLRADRMLRAYRTPTGGVDLHEVWHREIASGGELAALGC